MQKKISVWSEPLFYTILAFMVTVIAARIIGFMVIRTADLPKSLFLNINGYRLHHFVYGNVVIVALSFIELILGISLPKKATGLIYGIGLGLVIDEFALWSGAITYLKAETLQVFNGINIVAVVLTLLAMVYMLKRRLKLFRLEARVAELEALQPEKDPVPVMADRN
ncbi:MAG: hypothetical protein ACM3NH_03755 [Candidatus Saccharibacteria bacterium]